MSMLSENFKIGH